MYEGSLLSVFAVVMGSLLETTSQRLRSRLGRAAMLAVLGVLVLLIFFTQIRRLLALAVLLALFLSLRKMRLGALIRTPSRLLMMVLLVLTGAFLFTIGSGAWRQSSESFSTNNLSGRLTDVVERIGEKDTGDWRGKLTDRLTYMWLDAASIEQVDLLGRRISLSEMLLTTIVVSTPGVLLPDKYSMPAVTCENAFAALSLDIDLPCTPTSEGFLAAGFWGFSSLRSPGGCLSRLRLCSCTGALLLELPWP